MSLFETLRLQNMVVLARQLELKITFPSFALSPSSVGICVHVLHDHSFKKYAQHVSPFDTFLYRGFFFAIDYAASRDSIDRAHTLLAFYPKFENEGQSVQIAQRIVDEAAPEQPEGGAPTHGKPMSISIKHSGSLLLVSGDVICAKNSLNNEFTLGMRLLLLAHYERIVQAESDEPLSHQRRVKLAKGRVADLLDELARTRSSIGVEMVSRCHGHHGQLPNGEYFVVTALQRFSSAPGASVEFASPLALQDFALRWKLPINDMWIVPGRESAQRVKTLLDNLILSAPTTHDALAQLTHAVQESPGAIVIPGTYPHDEWQGSRIEGFVVSQSNLTSDELDASRALAVTAHANVLHLHTHPELVRPFSDMLLRHLDTERVPVANREFPPAVHSDQVKVHREALFERVHHLTEDCHMPPAHHVGAVTNSRENLARLEAMPICHQMDAEGGAMLSRAELERSGLDGVRDFLATVPPSSPLHAAFDRTCALPMAHGARTSVHDTKVAIELFEHLAGHATLPESVRMKMKMSGLSDTNVGYCILTFLMRNEKVKLDPTDPSGRVYLKAVANKLNVWWGKPLPAFDPQRGAFADRHDELRARIDAFARGWVAYLHAVPARLAQLQSDREHYLELAEEYIAGYLSGALRFIPRAPNAFQGIIYAVGDVPKSLLERICQRLDLRYRPALLPNHRVKFQRQMVAEGAVFRSPPPPDEPAVRVDKVFAASAGSHLFALVAGPALTNAGEVYRGMYRSATAIAHSLTQPIVQVPNDAHGWSENEQNTFVDSVLFAKWPRQGEPLPTPDLTLTFVMASSLPGLGKSSWTNALPKELVCACPANNNDAEQEERTGSATSSVATLKSSSRRAIVTVLHGDQLKNRFWAQVVSEENATYEGEQTTRVIVADKNVVPSPPGNIEKIVKNLTDADQTAIVVVPETTGQLDDDTSDTPDSRLPFSWELACVCLHRVLSRKNHDGALDGSNRAAARVFALFLSFYRGISRASFLDTLGRQFSRVYTVPVLAHHRPVLRESEHGRALVALLRQGMMQFQDQPKMDAEKVLSKEWEQQVRGALASCQPLLESLQRPLSDPVNALREHILDAVARPPDRQSIIEALDSTSTLYVSIDLPEPSSRDSLIALACHLSPALNSRMTKGKDKAGALRVPVSASHVTLWHRAKGEALPESLLDMCRRAESTRIYVRSIDVSLDHEHPIVAAHVILDDVTLPISNDYAHVTLLLGDGVAAVESNTLPSRLDASPAKAHRFPLDKPLELIGTIRRHT